MRGALLIAILFSLYSTGLCEEQSSPKELTIRAWEAWGAKDYEKTFFWTKKCVETYSLEAENQQSALKDLPSTDRIDEFESLNSVGTCFFIMGEAYLSLGKVEDAKEAFRIAIERFGYAQSWDPRGWFWSVKEKSEASLAKIEGQPKPPLEERPKPKAAKTEIVLYDTGKEALVDYKKYGLFEGIGTENYRYKILDQAGLSLAVGEGIYPNTSSVVWDPNFQKAKKDGRLEGNHWDFLYTDDLEANFYKWTQAPEPPGVRLFYTAFLLERSGLIKEAIRAYYAIVVHFPTSVGWTYWHTPWYVGQVAIERIEFLLREYPVMRMRLEGAKIKVLNGFDNSISNDGFIVNPGRIRKINAFEYFKERLGFKERKSRRVVEERGDGRIKLVKFDDGAWELRVDEKPFLVKAVAYSPSKIGQSPDEGTLDDWMQADYNKNGKIDGPYDSWVDKNKNNIQDPDEPNVGDFRLLKEMGANAIRVYHHASNKGLLRDLYRDYGIFVLMGDLLGAYTVGSGASWYEGTDYENPKHRENMINSVKKMVEEFKDEPYILMWVLGNENNYGVANNAKTKPGAYYKFVNEVAGLIKEMDNNQHSVAVCSGDLLYFDIFAKEATNVDIYGSNAYRGRYGFGRHFWEAVRDVADRPALIMEFGCPGYIQDREAGEAEEAQAEYHRGAWQDIEFNSSKGEGVGNALGGVVFEWVDEWWKAYEPFLHDTKRDFAGPFPDGYNYEEWLGICSQGDGSKSPFLRQLRKSYFLYKQLWED